MSTTGFEIDIDYTQAACSTVEDPDIFFPDGAADHWSKVNEAKAICGSCPVIDQCFQHGLHHEKIGIWGGHTPSELVEIRKQRGIDLETLVSDYTPNAQVSSLANNGGPVEYHLIRDLLD